MSASGRRIRAGALMLAAAAVLGGGPLEGSSAAEYAPAVQEMIVGAGNGVLAGARTVAASATSLRAGARSCAIASGTPLAALAAYSRAGGPGFALRDYGHCGGSAANSGELFVYSLGGESNRGQSGWEYKVDGVSGSTGAGDPSGPQGDGRRLRAAERVLWFWCEAARGGCQRTLELSYPASVSRGAPLTLSVYGADNEGTLSYVSGATVSLGTRSTSTRAYGHATLTAPSRPGSYTLSASRRGMVPSFPGTIVVR